MGEILCFLGMHKYNVLKMMYPYWKTCERCGHLTTEIHSEIIDEVIEDAKESGQIKWSSPQSNGYKIIIDALEFYRAALTEKFEGDVMQVNLPVLSLRQHEIDAIIAHVGRSINTHPNDRETPMAAMLGCLAYEGVLTVPQSMRKESPNDN